MNSKQNKGISYWMHRIPLDFLPLISTKRVLGNSSAHGRTVKEINVKDKLLLYATLKFPRADGQLLTPRLCFIGCAVVESLNDVNRTLVGYDKSARKLQLNEIRFFKEPLIIDDISDNLSFVGKGRKLSDYFKSEYRNIAKSDFNFVIKIATFTEALPEYLQETKLQTRKKLMHSDSELLEIFRTVLASLKLMRKDLENIEIKLFLKAVHSLFVSSGVDIDLQYLSDFYAKNAWRLKFEHIKTNDPELFVALYDKTGTAYNFGYIRLK